MLVEKWGNSLAIRIPVAVVEALDLKPGDDIEIHVCDDPSVAIEATPDAREGLATLRKYRGRLPADFKFDRLDSNRR